MRIKNLHLENFRCYKKIDLEFDERLTVLVGENGKGKTAVFDAIALSLSPAVQKFGFQPFVLSPKDARRQPVYDADGKHLVAMDRCYPVKIAAEFAARTGEIISSSLTASKDDVFWEGNLGSRAEVLFEQIKDTAAELPVLAYYGTARLWDDSTLFTASADGGRLLGYEEALQPTSSFHTFGKWFAQNAVTENNKDAQKVVEEAVDACMSSSGLNNLHYNKDMQCLVVQHEDFGELLVDDLSDGTRSVISMVADLAYRMLCLNPGLKDKAIAETEGIVLIDEVDMHLHPLWQQTILYDLLRTFPKVQFLVTTHSPQVLATVPANSIRSIYWEKGEIKVRKVNFSLGAEISRILEEIQQVESRPAFLPIVKELHQYLELVRQGRWDTEEARRLRKDLDSWAQGNEPALLRADMDIRLQSLRSRRK